MSTIQLKRSSVPGKIPVISQLVFGELALNYADGILYYKDADNTVQSLNSNASSLVNGAKTVTLDSDGLLTVPGPIVASGDPVSTWTSAITAIEIGTDTIITLADNEFISPLTGQVIVSGVQGTTQANGTWYYQVWNTNQIKLFSDVNVQTAVDSTAWSAYTSGGNVLNEVPPGVVLKSGLSSWGFDATGELTLPTGGHLGFAGKGWTGLDGGFGNAVSVFSYYSNGNFSSCVSPYAYGTVGITTYTDGDGVGGEWFFNVDGSVQFPNKPTNARTGTGNALLFNKDTAQKVIATQAGTISQPTVERLIIAGGDGFGTGEGGDIYLWAGRSGQSDGGAGGGDIKVDAGDAYNSYGGTVKIRGGNGYNGAGSAVSAGGWVEVTAGSSYNGGDGANITLTAGNAYSGGADGNVAVRTGKGTHSWNFNADGTFDVPGMIQLNSGTITSNAGTTIRSYDGDFVITVDEAQTPTVPYVAWTFKQDGNLQLPDNGTITFDRNNTSISVGMGFHIRSGEGVSLDAVDQGDSANLITRGWYVGSDGTLNASDANNYYARACITLINFPAEDSGFGLTTPDGVTHDFKYDYDGNHGAETPILIALGTDSIETVVDKTIVVLNNSGLFGNVHWDATSDCIWIYQLQSGVIGNQTNINYGYTDGVSSFSGATNGSIVFGDGSIQTTAFRPDALEVSGDIEITDKTKGIILTSPNNTRYRVTIDDAGVLVSTAL